MTTIAIHSFLLMHSEYQKDHLPPLCLLILKSAILEEVKHSAYYETKSYIILHYIFCQKLNFAKKFHQRFHEFFKRSPGHFYY